MAYTPLSVAEQGLKDSPLAIALQGFYGAGSGDPYMNGVESLMVTGIIRPYTTIVFPNIWDVEE
jgi:hypothetical protein